MAVNFLGAIVELEGSLAPKTSFSLLCKRFGLVPKVPGHRRNGSEVGQLPWWGHPKLPKVFSQQRPALEVCVLESWDDFRILGV